METLKWIIVCWLFIFLNFAASHSGRAESTLPGTLVSLAPMVMPGGLRVSWSLCVYSPSQALTLLLSFSCHALGMRPFSDRNAKKPCTFQMAIGSGTTDWLLSKHCQATVGGWGLLTSFPAVPSWGFYLPVLMLASFALHQGRMTAVPSLGHSWIVCIHDHFAEPNFKIQFQKGMYHLSSRFCPLYLKPSICPINTYRSKKTKKKIFLN